MSPAQEKSAPRLDAEIFFVSALILFLELALIRWLGTEIRIFAYLGNLILVVCFFGCGVGCYLAARGGSLVRLAVNLMMLVMLVANPLKVDWLDFRQVTDWLSGFETLLFGVHPVASLGCSGSWG